MSDTLKVDFRKWLASTVANQALVGAPPAVPSVYFTAVPTTVNGGFIAMRFTKRNDIHSTSKSGDVVQARAIVACCFKGADPVNDYAKAEAIAQAVKDKVKTADGTWRMGDTIIFQLTIDDRVEGDGGDAEVDQPFNFHAGASSGIQQIDVAVAFHYWSTNA
jgi:hypothetical protein